LVLAKFNVPCSFVTLSWQATVTVKLLLAVANPLLTVALA